MRQLRNLIVAAIGVMTVSYGGVQAGYDAGERIWNLSNGLISAQFQLTADGHFLTRQISNTSAGEAWTAAASRPTSPIRLQTDSDLFDAATVFDLYAQHTDAIRNGVRESIVLRDVLGRAQITVVLE